MYKIKGPMLGRLGCWSRVDDVDVKTCECLLESVLEAFLLHTN